MESQVTRQQLRAYDRKVASEVVNAKFKGKPKRARSKAALRIAKELMLERREKGLMAKLPNQRRMS